MCDLPHRCEVCGDDCTIYLSPACHAGMPVFCVLTGDVLTLECAECRQLVVRFRVAGMIEKEFVAPEEK